MVCSCTMTSNSVWLQIIFCSCVKETVLFSFLRPLLHDKTRMIRQLLNSVIAKYRDLSVSRRSIICLNLRLRQIIDLLATDKSRYFVQPRPIIVNYFVYKKQSTISPNHFNSYLEVLFLQTGALKPSRVLR